MHRPSTWRKILLCAAGIAVFQLGNLASSAAAQSNTMRATTPNNTGNNTFECIKGRTRAGAKCHESDKTSFKTLEENPVLMDTSDKQDYPGTENGIFKVSPTENPANSTDASTNR